MVDCSNVIKRARKHIRVGLLGEEPEEEVSESFAPLKPPSAEELEKTLQDQRRRKSELEALEWRVISTDDMHLLDGFAMPETYKPPVATKEQLPWPSALFDIHKIFRGEGEFPIDQFLEMYKADVRTFYPKIEIKEVETTSGEKVLAFVGISAKDLGKVLSFRHERRAIALAAAHTSELLHGTKPSVADPSLAYVHALDAAPHEGIARTPTLPGARTPTKVR